MKNVNNNQYWRCRRFVRLINNLWWLYPGDWLVVQCGDSALDARCTDLFPGIFHIFKNTKDDFPFQIIILLIDQLIVRCIKKHNQKIERKSPPQLSVFIVFSNQTEKMFNNQRWKIQKTSKSFHRRRLTSYLIFCQLTKQSIDLDKSHKYM